MSDRPKRGARSAKRSGHSLDTGPHVGRSCENTDQSGTDPKVNGQEWVSTQGGR